MTSHLILNGDVLAGLKTLKDCSVQCVVTSPPYSCQVEACNEEWGLRNYGVDGQLGLEKTPEEYVAKMVEVFREVRRVLRDDGTLWLNLGDSYGGQCGNTHSEPNKLLNSKKQLSNCGSWGVEIKRVCEDLGIKPKDMVGIPWRVAFALQADGWYLRSDIIWAKRNCMPESVTDRPTKAHEYIFLLTKQPRYFYDGEAIREPSADPAGYLSRCQSDFNGRPGCLMPSGKEQETAVRGKRQPHGFKQDQTGNPTYTGFNDRWREGTRRTREGSNGQQVHPEGITHDLGSGITRNKRTVWWINPQPRPEAHFATFPDELAETCIKAGTSEYGCCQECGAPWERIIEKEKPPDSVYTNTRQDDGFTVNKGVHRDGKAVGCGGTFQKWLNEHPPKTTGWKPTCTCGKTELESCVVLDPFMGSGTVAVIARDLNRSSIGIELNPEYVKIIKERLQAHSQLDTGVIQYRFEKVPV